MKKRFYKSTLYTPRRKNMLSWNAEQCEVFTMSISAKIALALVSEDWKSIILCHIMVRPGTSGWKEALLMFAVQPSRICKTFSSPSYSERPKVLPLSWPTITGGSFADMERLDSKFTTHLHQVLKLKCEGLHLHFCTLLHDMVLRHRDNLLGH
jgi:hypothetical protein